MKKKKDVFPDPFKIKEMNMANYEKSKPKNLLKPNSLIGTSKMRVKTLEKISGQGNSLERGGFNQTSRYSRPDARSTSPSGISQSDSLQANIVNVYEMWKENPNMTVKASNHQHVIGKQSFNK